MTARCCSQHPRKAGMTRSFKTRTRCRWPAIARRFRLALAWLAIGTLLGALLPGFGVAIIAAFILYYWLPIAGEIGSVKRRRQRRNRTEEREPNTPLDPGDK
jgi:hypothetical protein